MVYICLIFVFTMFPFARENHFLSLIHLVKYQCLTSHLHGLQTTVWLFVILVIHFSVLQNF